MGGTAARDGIGRLAQWLSPAWRVLNRKCRYARILARRAATAGAADRWAPAQTHIGRSRRAGPPMGSKRGLPDRIAAPVSAAASGTQYGRAAEHPADRQTAQPGSELSGALAA